MKKKRWITYVVASLTIMTILFVGFWISYLRSTDVAFERELSRILEENGYTLYEPLSGEQEDFDGNTIYSWMYDSTPKSHEEQQAILEALKSACSNCSVGAMETLGAGTSHEVRLAEVEFPSEYKRYRILVLYDNSSTDGILMDESPSRSMITVETPTSSTKNIWGYLTDLFN